MKATIDVPDELYRRVKAKSALEGRAVREVAVALFRRYVGEGRITPAPGPDRPPKRAARRDDTRAARLDRDAYPAWFGAAREHMLEAVADHSLEAIRDSIERGWAEDVAAREASPRRRRRR
jgi:hypothetical protein